MISAGVTYEDYAIKSPGGGLTSIEDVHTPSTAPGLGENPAYIHTTISAGYDWRPAPAMRGAGAFTKSHSTATAIAEIR